MTDDDGRESNPPRDAGDGSAPGDDIENYYDLLDVSPSATPTDIERAYRETAKRQHPDASDLPEADAEARFRQVLRARDILTNPQTRREYDDLGHAEYCRQTGSAAGVTMATDKGDTQGNLRPGHSDPESRPSPEPGPPPSGSQAQTSARGAAQKRGDTTVTTPSTHAGGATQTPSNHGHGGLESDPTDESDSSGTRHWTNRGMTNIYDVGVGDGTASGRSLQVIFTVWTEAWYLRAAVGVVLAVLLVSLDGVGTQLLEGLGSTRTVPTPDTAQGYWLTLLSLAIVSVVSCLRVERTLAPGTFLADRDLGRFSRDASHRAQHRGAMALLAVLAFSALLATNGTNAWGHTRSLFVGTDPAFPWFDIAAINLTAWDSVLDWVITGAFLSAAVFGTLALTLGLSVELWRARYELGLPVRPSILEWILTGAILTVPVSFAVPSTPLHTLPPSVLANQAIPASMLAIEDGIITIQTLAIAAIVSLLLLTAVLRLWGALATDGAS